MNKNELDALAIKLRLIEMNMTLSMAAQGVYPAPHYRYVPPAPPVSHSASLDTQKQEVEHVRA